MKKTVIAFLLGLMAMNVSAKVLEPGGWDKNAVPYKGRFEAIELTDSGRITLIIDHRTGCEYLTNVPEGGFVQLQPQREGAYNNCPPENVWSRKGPTDEQVYRP